MERRQLAAECDDGLPAAVAGFEVYESGYGMRPDWSLESLCTLEAQAPQLFTSSEAVFRSEDLPVVRAFMAYVGLTLMNLNGGSLDWDDSDGLAARARRAQADPVQVEQVIRHYWGWDENPAATDDTGRPVPFSRPQHCLKTGAPEALETFDEWSR